MRLCGAASLAALTPDLVKREAWLQTEAIVNFTLLRGMVLCGARRDESCGHRRMQ